MKIKNTIIDSSFSFLGIIGLILIFGLVLGGFSSASWYSGDGEYVASVKRMHHNEMTRYADAEKFRPGDFVTREQAAKFFAEYSRNILGVDRSTILPAEGIDCIFTDESVGDSSLRDYLADVCVLGLMKGSNDFFRPQDTITKAEALTVLVRTSQGILDETGDPWWKTYYTYAENNGLTKEKDVYALGTSLTRYEMALLLSRASGEDISQWYPSEGNSKSGGVVDPDELEELGGILNGFGGYLRTQ